MSGLGASSASPSTLLFSFAAGAAEAADNMGCATGFLFLFASAAAEMRPGGRFIGARTFSGVGANPDNSSLRGYRWRTWFFTWCCVFGVFLGLAAAHKAFSSGSSASGELGPGAASVFPGRVFHRSSTGAALTCAQEVRFVGAGG